MPRWLILLVVFTAASRAIVALGDDPAAPRRIYLDEYLPESSLKTQLHPPRRAKFPCVNVHFHPGKLNASQVDEAVAVMDEANVAVSVSLDGHASSKFAEHSHALLDRHPNRFVVFVRMDYVGDGQTDDPKSWDVTKPDFGVRMADRLTEAVRQGASGLKLLKSLGLTIRDADGKLIAPDDPRFDPVWQRAGELGIPVIWHCADPVAFFRPIDERNERHEELSRQLDWSFHGGDFPKHQDLIDARNRVIERHPSTTFICAHFADVPEDLEKLGGYLDRSPNMFVEFGARISELGRQPFTARAFFLKYPDRILFGTDGVPPATELVPHFQMLETRDEYFPYEDDPFPPQGSWRIYGLDLPDDVLRQVYFENAARIIPGVKSALEKYGEAHPEAAAQLKKGSRSPARWEKEIAKFDEEDRKGFRTGGVLFVGSSSIRLWDLEKSFPGKSYVNRGFGGCEASDVLHFTRRIVLPRKPDVVVFYAGDNDIASGKTAVRCADDFAAFAAMIHQELPKTHIVYLPVKASLSRWKLFHRQRAANTLIESICIDDPLAEYVDLVTPMLGADGTPEPTLFLDDGLHLNDKGYELWTSRLAPLLNDLAARPAADAGSSPDARQ
jgi:lysophospholipase L1-like esterase